jgi:hypothetical protein
VQLRSPLPLGPVQHEPRLDSELAPGDVRQHYARVTNPDRFSHWWKWHLDYDDPDSDLSRRLAVVQARIRQAVTELPVGAIRLVSACAGQGRDVVGALNGHPRALDVTGRLVEWDEDNVTAAREALLASGLRGIEVEQGDAALTDAYEGAVPADLVLLCGVFGNVTDEDVEKTASNASRLCAPGAVVIWTRHRRPPDLTPAIRGWFERAGFAELAFDSPNDQSFAVGTHQLDSAPLPFQPGLRLFTFE